LNDAQEEQPLYLDHTLSFEVRVNDLVSRMTLEEKISQMINTAIGIPRLNVPKYNWWNECLHGVLTGDPATVFPQAIGLAATWNENLIYKVANAISDEARAKHHEYVRRGKRGLFQGLTFWSPNVNLFRDPRWGRGQETYGEDPYLSSRMGINFVKGLQGDDPKYLKVVATPKHYVVHSGPEGIRHHFNAVATSKQLYETYLPAFEACIREAKAYSVMCAYNRTNEDPCCSSEFLLQKILRDDWGFEGYVVSDCGAIGDIYSGHKMVKTAAEAAAVAINSGCDLFCQVMFANIRNKKRFWQWMIDAVAQKLLSVDTIDKSVKRLFMARFKLGMFDPPEIVQYQQIPFELNDSEKHRKLALEAARESIVLLKNESNILPLNKNVKSIAVIGPNAEDLEVLKGNYSGNPSCYTTFLEGIKKKVSSNTQIYYVKGCGLTNESKYEFDKAIEMANNSDIVIMVMGISHLYEGEEGNSKLSVANGDRISLDLPGVQEDLLKTVHEIGKPIVLILTSGSSLSINFAHENIPAIIQAWYPGEEGGAATADVIFGDYNPAGRLPVTFYKSVEDLPPFEDYSMKGRTYRYFKGETLYPFGYGLSYTKFKYSNLEISPKNVNIGENLDISVEIENIGQFKGDEIVQLYLSKKSSELDLPIRELQGFKRVSLEKSEKITVSFTLTPKNIYYVNNEGKRIIEPGKVKVSIGGCQPGFSEDGLNLIEGDFEIFGKKLEIK